MDEIEISLPIVIMKEGKWFVASCPPLDVASQGKTEQEARENIADLIDEYLNDKDTIKPELSITLASLSYIMAKIPKERATEWANSDRFLQTS